jgi:hypothetical protein
VNYGTECFLSPEDKKRKNYCDDDVLSIRCDKTACWSYEDKVPVTYKKIKTFDFF